MKNKLLSKLISEWYKKNLEIVVAPIFIGMNYILLYLSSAYHFHSEHTVIEIIYLGILLINTISLIFQLTLSSNMYRENYDDIAFFNVYNLDKLGLLILLIRKRFFLFLLEVAVGCIWGFIYLKSALLLFNKLIEDGIWIKNVENENILFHVIIIQCFILCLTILYDAKHIFVAENNFSKKNIKSKYRAFFAFILILISEVLFVFIKANFLSLLLLVIALFGLATGLYYFFRDFIPVFVNYLLTKLRFVNSKIFFLLTRFKSICLKNSFNLLVIVFLGSFWLITVTLAFSFYADKGNVTQSGSELDTVIVDSNVSREMLKVLAKDYQVDIGKVYSTKLSLPELAVINNGVLSSKTSSLLATNYLSIISLKDYNKLYQSNLLLKENEVYVYAPFNNIDITQLELQNKKYVVRRIEKFKLSFNYNHALNQTIFVVTNDVRLLKKNQISVVGFNILGSQSRNYDFSTALQDSGKYANENYTSKILSYSILKKFFGSILFVGICISFVLFLVLGTFLNTNKYFSFDKIEKDVVSMLKCDFLPNDIKFLLYISYSLVFWMVIFLIYFNSMTILNAMRNIITMFSFYDIQLLNHLFNNFFIAFITIASLIFLISIKSYSSKVNCSIYDYANNYY